jgi:hypothetical protein
MKYLHDNGFRVLTMSDLGYDEDSNYLYVRNSGYMMMLRTVNKMKILTFP